MFRKSIFLAACVAATAVSGCASMAVTGESLEDKTAFALGLEKGEFSISNRVDNGVRTDYAVRTKRGQEYRCYVTGIVSLMGRAVSDAMCSKKGEPARNPLMR